jgi:hypothetical protein
MASFTGEANILMLTTYVMSVKASTKLCLNVSSLQNVFQKTFHDVGIFAYCIHLRLFQQIQKHFNVCRPHFFRVDALCSIAQQIMNETATNFEFQKEPGLLKKNPTLSAF